MAWARYDSRAVLHFQMFISVSLVLRRLIVNVIATNCAVLYVDHVQQGVWSPSLGAIIRSGYSFMIYPIYPDHFQRDEPRTDLVATHVTAVSAVSAARVEKPRASGSWRSRLGRGASRMKQRKQRWWFGLRWLHHSVQTSTLSNTAMQPISEKQRVNSATPPEIASSNDNACLNRYPMHHNFEFQAQPAPLYCLDHRLDLLITSLLP